MKRILLKIHIVLIVLMSASCSTSSFFYAPSKEFTEYPDTTAYYVEEINFKSSSGKNLNGWFLKPKQKAIIATVLQLHGNAGNISMQYQFTEPLLKAGFQVMVFDYEGYGKSEGKPSQENVLDDAIQALQYIKKREDVKNTKLILFGQSLGGHLSCVVAAKEQQLLDALVVEGAFSGHETMAIYVSAKNGAPAWLTKLAVQTKYDAIDYMDKITIPKLIIHSTEDATCPFFMGQELYMKALQPKDFWEIKGPHLQASNLYPNEFVEHFKKLIQ